MEEAELCFPQVNTSCRKTNRPHWEATLSYSVLSFITLLTVVLNLLVIISISHFRKLHTATNLLLLSLAVADFIVGFLQMPGEILLYRGCWDLGDSLCAVNYFLGFLSVSASVGNMVLLSIDRYIAICDPMFYSTKVTLTRARAMRSHITAVTAQRSNTITAKKSEMKAARTLGIVVVAFIVCNCPYYCFTVAAENNFLGASAVGAELWLLYFNSCLNPVIYVFFYPWFRKAIKHIVTLQILKPGSSEANIV
ncbi:trace amine-associated receptor 9-like [Epinephelus fuscoguttatus]|uniref:trace amine-associated receptor 9-like n=1 Tax=Epinephelus fuscoguttatus TaxID=293821 RepID=UPI0020D16B7D|nr:trace amine-associated receptor 9-like [Epinephelus fuscoguttatus]